jgi:hypothetical protein
MSAQAQSRQGSQLGQLAVTLALAACASPSPMGPDPGPDAGPASGPLASVPQPTLAKAPETLWQALANGETRSLVVAIRQPLLPSDVIAFADLRAIWQNQKQVVLSQLTSPNLAVDQSWDQLPLIQVTASSVDAAAALLGNADVDAAFEIQQYQLTDAESFPLINQPLTAAAGMIGAGTSVAILDTGTDYTKADFGSCTAPGVPAGCKVAYAADFAPNDNSRDDNGHGTNVAAIALGVAPGAKILALDVFTGTGGSSNDIISAINWAIANKATYNIASMNLSLGGGSSTALCPSDAMGIALGAARTAGIAPVVATGNNGYTNAISMPACAPAAISVGAVYDSNVGAAAYGVCQELFATADQVTCFSNSASFFTILAPGAMITAAGYTMTGTSQATPHVAGALAVLRAAFPAESVDQLVARMTSTGKPIKDNRNGLTKPRLDLYAAVGSPIPDTAAPTGAVVINGGAAATKTAAVTLAISGSDNVGVTQMCVSNTATCTAWEAFATTKAWTLATGDGIKIVTVSLRDKVLNTTAVADKIILDATAPTGGALTAVGGDGQIALAWTGFTDAAGITTYRVVGAAGATAPAHCLGATLYADAGATFTQTGLTNGTAYSYRVCAVDLAGNVSAGVTASATPRPESNPPVGTIVINGGAATTKALAVTLTLAATDDTKVATMCLSETATCTAYVTYAASLARTFAAGEGNRTINVWYRDTWGNTSAPVSATIKVDTVAPTGGAVTATYGDGQVKLAWSGFADATSGLAAYRVVGAAGATAPASCLGATLYADAAATFTQTGLTNGTAYSYRVCAVDLAGNVSAGVTASATPRPESNPPVGTIVINAGAAYTRSLTVALTLAATDDTAVTQMCLSETTACTAFVAYATTASRTFAAGEVAHTVYVWYRDTWGNTAAPVSATIKVDTVAPTGGAVTATYGDGQVTLAWTASADTNSGVAGYRVVAAVTTAPASCLGATLYEGTGLTFTAANLTNGTTYAFRVCAVDKAGNVAAGVTATAAPRPESNPPVGTIVINGGAAATRSLTVTLALAATDDTAVTQMCLSETTACTAFVPYAATMTRAFAAGDGVRTIRVWYRDTWGNTAAPVAATIKLDTTAPAGGTLAATVAVATINLTWTAATDASGVASYRLVGNAGAVVPATGCTTGTVLYEGTALTFAHTVTAKAAWSYRLCATDTLGNTAAGVTKAATAL